MSGRTIIRFDEGENMSDDIRDEIRGVFPRVDFDGMSQMSHRGSTPGLREAGTKIHLKRRDGWEQTEIKAPGTLPDHRMRYVIPEVRRPGYVTIGSIGPAQETVTSLYFECVKMAVIEDYKKRTTRQERWYEEV